MNQFGQHPVREVKATLEDRSPRLCLRVQRATVTLAGLLALGSGIIASYCNSFDQFAPYDDQGTLMFSVAGYLRGQPLYDQVPTPYGPAYYFYQALLHGYLRLPLTTDAVRLLCIFHCLLAAVLLAAAAFRLTRSTLIALFVSVVGVFHLIPLGREPGHPQELVAIVLALAALVVSSNPRATSRLTILGILAAVLSMLKINAGLFFCAGLATAMCCRTAFIRQRPGLFWPVVSFASLFPLFLMHSQLGQDRTLGFAIVACLGLFATSMVAYVSTSKIQSPHWMTVAAAFVGTLLLSSVALLLSGSSFVPALENLLLKPMKLPELLHGTAVLPGSGWSAFVSVVVAMATIFARNRLRPSTLLLTLGKLLFGAIATLCIPFDYDYYRESLGYLLPWSWLVLVQVPSGEVRDADESFARTFVALQAVWQGLQAYPVPGTQAVIGSFLIVLSGGVCLHDALITFGRQLGTRSVRFYPVFKPLAAGSIVALSFIWFEPLWNLKRYNSLQSLSIPGSNLVHIGREQVRAYKAIVEYLKTQNVPFVTIPNFYSLYFWTGIEPPTYSMCSIGLMTVEEQTSFVRTIAAAPRALVILNDAHALMPGTPGATFETLHGTVPEFVRKNCMEITRIDQFRILEVTNRVPAGTNQ